LNPKKNFCVLTRTSCDTDWNVELLFLIKTRLNKSDSHQFFPERFVFCCRNTQKSDSSINGTLRKAFATLLSRFSSINSRQYVAICVKHWSNGSIKNHSFNIVALIVLDDSKNTWTSFWMLSKPENRKEKNFLCSTRWN
jgi:hypothetical protein